MEENHKDHTGRNILLGLVALALIGLIIFFAKKDNDEVTNTGNNNASSTSSWTLSNDDARGISFRYPPMLNAKYIQAFDWPPEVAVVDGPLSCIEAGAQTSRAGKTTKQTINGHEYCVTEIVEAAAGSAYHQYAYARQMEDGRVAILTFSTRLPNCANYPEGQKNECEAERSMFDIGKVVDEIFGTLVLGEPSLEYEKG